MIVITKLQSATQNNNSYHCMWGCHKLRKKKIKEGFGSLKLSEVCFLFGSNSCVAQTSKKITSFESDASGLPFSE
jgi:hypothetical protein